MSPISLLPLFSFTLALLHLPSGTLSSQECEQILEKEGDFYVLGVFRICDQEGYDLAAYVFAQAFRFSLRHGGPSHRITLGYKLVTYCEQPSGCPEKILKEIEGNHSAGLQTVVTVFSYGNGSPVSSRFKNISQVNVGKDKIHFSGHNWKINSQGALESLLALIKYFQWNLVGFIHYYDVEFIDIIEKFDQRDKEEVCLEFKEKNTYDGKHLAERISSSKSNVTVAIDAYYSAISYMQMAIGSSQATQITGKQIIQCCGDTIFELEDFAPSAFQGVFSLFRKPRQLSGFRDYLLGFDAQLLENTTANYIYKMICHRCTANASFYKPCRNFNTFVGTNTMAGLFNISEFEDCPGGSVYICSTCLSSLAGIDTIFMMHSFINTLGLATEDMYNKKHPSLPQNGSSFHEAEYTAYLRNNYPQLLLMNQNPFDAYYWNITADGELAVLKVDVDLGNGESTSYNPVDRSVQVEDGGTITMLPSHCFRVCQPGEKKKLHSDFAQLCCYQCEACEPGTYSNGSAFEECWPCREDEWSQRGEWSCWKKSIVYLFWTEPSSVFLVLLSISGMVLTISVLVLHVRHKDTPIVKAAGGPAFYCSMASLLFSFSSVLLFFGEPTLWKCKIRRPIFGISFAVCLSSILAKCVRVLCAFANPVGRPTKLQAILYQIILGTGSALQLAICCFWFFLNPPGVRHTFPKNQPYMIIECFNEIGIGFSFLIGYLCLLAFLCLSVAIKGHTLPKMFNDSQGISFMIMTFFAVWLSVMPVLDSGKERVAEMVCIASILLSSFSCLAFLFFQKCYIMLFKPEQNTPEWIKKSTFEYCQQIASKASLSIHLETSTATIDTAI